MKTSFWFRIRFTHPAVLIALLLFTDACNSNESVPTVYDVPQEFQSIIDQFQLEAISRGYDIQIDNLIIRYDAEVEAPYCATCNSKSLDAAYKRSFP
jgi:hypothetical protein